MCMSRRRFPASAVHTTYHGASGELLGDHRGEPCSHLLSNLAGQGMHFPKNVYAGSPRDYHLHIKVAWPCVPGDAKTEGKGELKS